MKNLNGIVRVLEREPHLLSAHANELAAVSAGYFESVRQSKQVLLRNGTFFEWVCCPTTTQRMEKPPTQPEHHSADKHDEQPEHHAADKHDEIDKQQECLAAKEVNYAGMTIAARDVVFRDGVAGRIIARAEDQSDLFLLVQVWASMAAITPHSRRWRTTDVVQLWPVEQIIQAVAWYSEADHFIVLTETETLTKEPQSFAKVDQLIEKGTKMCVWLKRMVSSYNLRTT